MRFSLVLISFGTPIFMAFTVCGLLFTVFRPQTYNCLPVRGEELRSYLHHGIRGDRVNLAEHLVQRPVMVIVEGESGQPGHPRAGALQREHDLAFELLLSVAELERWQPLAGELGVLIPNGSVRVVGRAWLGADIHPKLPRRL